MRVKVRDRRVILAVSITAAMGLFALSMVERPELRQSPGQAQLVSIEQLPDYGNMCSWEPPAPTAENIGALAASGLFEELALRSVHAAGQNGGTTVDVTRPPVRTIQDKYPIYSS